MAHPWPSESTGHPYRWRPPAEVNYFVANAKATTATAGTPGSFGPAGNGGVNTLGDMTGVTASPTTAWTTGQRVVCNDGTEVHWSSTAWVAGRA
jgi:hypothetical protein